MSFPHVIDLAMALCGISLVAILFALVSSNEHRYSIALTGYLTISVILISWLGLAGWLTLGMAEAFDSHRMPSAAYAFFLVPVGCLILLGLAVLPLFPLSTSRNYALAIFGLAVAGSLATRTPRLLIGIAILAVLWTCVHQIRRSELGETSP